jgi:predicted Zn-dependent peptidase
MQYQQHQLSNGLTILGECNPRAHFSAFGFFVKTGARDETPEIGGVSHFLEHMVFKGTPNRSADQVNEMLDEMGSASNASTSVESTIYHAAVLPEFQSQLVELFSDLMRPSLRDDDFETEKKVIIEEIMMYADQPPYGGHEKIMADFFGDHPLGNSVLGTVDTVGALKAPQMKSYFEERYSPGNIAIAAGGKVDFDQLVKDVESHCGSWNSVKTERSVPTAEPRFGFESIHKESSTLQYIIQLTPGPARLDPDRYAARLLSTILGDDSGSRMFWEFIDSGRAESAGMGSYEYYGTGLIMSVIYCLPDQAQDNLNRLNQLQSKARDGITQKELDLAKSKVASHIILASERTESRMFSVGSQWLAGQDYLTVAEIAKRYQDVTLEEVNSVVAKYDLTKNMTLVVGPRDDLKPAAELV